MGRPSDEQLLGLRRPLREIDVSFEPPPPPEWILTEAPAAGGPAISSRRRRLGPRDFVALAAVAAVVWLAVRTGDGLPFRSSEPPAPAAASNVVRTTLAPDRLDLEPPATRAVADTSGAKESDQRKDQTGSTGPGGKDDPPTGGGGGDETKPLLEATVPGVGTVTVDQPDVPKGPDIEAPTLPALPDTGELLSETATVSLP